MSVLNEVAQWQIEATNEDPHRYFFHTKDFEKITSGSMSFVIGRKGSGKTAIAERLAQRNHSSFSRKLSFRDFPFGLLYSRPDDSYSHPHQYITIWRYVIYRYICSMMVENQDVARNFSESICKKFQIDITDALDLTVERITGSELNASFLGVSGSKRKNTESVPISLSEANKALSDFIWSNVDDCPYFVLFDELDEDYGRVLEKERREEYFSLIVGLFQAIELISAESKRHGRKVMPIAFLRDDIFELCPSQDRNKWLDKATYLTWTSTQLRNLLNFRLYRAANPHARVAKPGEGWPLVFDVVETRFGTKRKKKKNTFDYLLDHTFARPRDIVHIVRESARQSIDMGLERINNAAITAADLEHSRYMKREVQAEFLPIMEENDFVFEAISVMGKQLFRYNELKERLAMTFNSHGYKCPLTDAQVVRMLYRFNVIGNEESGRRFFLYNSSSRSVDLEGNLCVHRGLLKALDVY